MAITFEFLTGKGFHFAEAFGSRFGVPVADDRVFLPAFLGNGYIQEVELRQGLNLCLHHYRLVEDFSLRRLKSTQPSDRLTLKFNCRQAAVEAETPETHLFALGCEAELGTDNFFTEISFPAQQEIHFLVINISRELLVQLLQLGDDHSALRDQLVSTPSFVLNIRMSAAMEQIVKEFSEITPGVALSQLRYQAKTMELMYLLFEKLTKRRDNNEISVNRADAEKLYEVRSAILQDLSSTPNLTQLSQKIAMSPTKMKMLFRQIFGDSIYNYYQTARMNEASRLLKDHSVSETAYRLGFSNLSHFSRLFEKYFKLKPKKYKGQSAHSSPVRRQQING